MRACVHRVGTRRHTSTRFPLFSLAAELFPRAFHVSPPSTRAVLAARASVRARARAPRALVRARLCAACVRVRVRACACDLCPVLLFLLFMHDYCHAAASGGQRTDTRGGGHIASGPSRRVAPTRLTESRECYLVSATSTRSARSRRARVASPSLASWIFVNISPGKPRIPTFRT